MFDGRMPLKMNSHTGKICAHHRISRVTISSFHQLPNVTGSTWKMTSQEQKDKYYREFQKAFSWPSDWEHQVKKMWHEKTARRYSGFISSLKVMYKAGKSRPIYIPLELWSGLINHWKDRKVIKWSTRKEGKNDLTGWTWHRNKQKMEVRYLLRRDLCARLPRGESRS